ncbi:MAG: STAS domain-containing protein [bacterium]|nr:STAS domain-containing protein [bacterium]
MISLNENIGVKTIKEFHSSLSDELKNNDEIIIDFSAIKRVDLSVVQVIIAAGRKARKEGKTIKLKQVADAIKEQMQICGLRAGGA